MIKIAHRDRATNETIQWNGLMILETQRVAQRTIALYVKA
jgi:hypothetical protein